jgi:hypothetical protein
MLNITCRLSLLALLLLPLTGCEEEEIAWLPDSSGLVFRDVDQGFSRYDIATKMTTQLIKPAEDGSKQPLGLAISPKGDEFALAKVTRGPESRTLDLAIYDIAGKETFRAKPLKIHAAIGEANVNDAGLEWTVSGQLVVYQDQDLLGFYDLKTKAFRGMLGYQRYMERWTGRCACPDGSGVLAKKPSTEEELFPTAAWFIDWEGNAKHIEIPAPPAPVTSELGKENHCLAYYGSWSEGTLRHQVQDYRLDIDTRAGTAKWFSLPLQMTAKIPARNPKFGYIAQPFGAGFYAYVGMDEKRSVLGVVNPQTKVSKVLFQDIELNGSLRSPDGKRIAFNITEKIKGQEKAKVSLVIIDETGSIAAKIDRGEFELPPPSQNVPEVPPAAGAPAPPAPPAP